MQAYKRRRVFAEQRPPGGTEQADKLPLLDCADLRPCLFQLVEQPGCSSSQHSVISSQPNLLPQRTRRTQRKSGDWVIGPSENKPTTEARRRRENQDSPVSSSAFSFPPCFKSVGFLLFG